MAAPTTFEFRGYHASNAKPASGKLNAADVDDAKAQLEARGIVAEVPPRPVSGLSAFLTSDIGGSELAKPKLKEWSQVLRSLASAEQSGIPLPEAIDVLIKGLPPKSKSRAVLVEISRGLSDGLSAEQAFTAHTEQVGETTAALVAAGASSGKLGETLGRLAGMTERAVRQKRQIVGAMSYPAIIFGLTMLIALGLLMTIIPTFEEVFTELEIDLPPLTRGMIAVGTTLRTYWMFLPTMPALVYFTWKWARAHEKHGPRIDKTLLKLPLFGNLLHMGSNGRVADVFAVMTGASVPADQALGFAQQAAGNKAIASAVGRVREQYEDGVTVAEAWRSEPLLDEIVAMLLEQGAKSGRTDELLARRAVQVDEELEVKVKALTESLQPILMGLVMLVVGVLGIAIYSPVLSIYDDVAG